MEDMLSFYCCSVLGPAANWPSDGPVGWLPRPLMQYLQRASSRDFGTWLLLHLTFTYYLDMACPIRWPVGCEPSEEAVLLCG